MLNKTLFLCGFVLFATFTALKSQNLVQNGNFEQGRVGFTSGLRYLQTSDRTPGVYTVGANANVFQIDFPACLDHTPVGELMLIVNGSLTVNSKIWEQTITVQPNQTYAVSFWYQNVTPGPDDLSLLLFVNNVMVGRDSTGTIPACSWYPVRGIWRSGSATTATIRIEDAYNIFNGDDFAIDDIVLENKTGINSPDFGEISLKMSPNPTTSNVNVQLDNVPYPVDLSVINAIGQIVSAQTLDGNQIRKETNIDMSQQAAGFYTLKANMNGRTTVRKFIVQH